MYKSTKKEDLVAVAKELGLVIPENAIILTIKQKIEASPSFKDDPEFVANLISNTVADRKADEHTKIESAQLAQTLEIEKLKLSRVEKELEIASRREDPENPTNAANNTNQTISTDNSVPSIDNLLRSIKTLSMPFPSRAENLNLFFHSLERAFTHKQVPTQFKAEILITILGERANSVLLYISETELKDYDKVKEIVLKQFQPTASETLINFRRTRRLPNETFVNYANRLTVSFKYYLELRNVKTVEEICQLMVSDKLFSTLDRDTQSHISIRQANSWFPPSQLAVECDNYFTSKRKSLAETQQPPSSFERNNFGYQNRQPPNENLPRPFYRNNRNFNGQTNTETNPQNISQNENAIYSITVRQPCANTNIVNELQYETLLVNNVKVTGLVDSACSIICIHSSMISPHIKYEKEIIVQDAFSKQTAKLANIKISLPNNPQNVLIVPVAVCKKMNHQLIIPPNVLSKLDTRKEKYFDSSNVNQPLQDSFLQTKNSVPTELSPDVKRNDFSNSQSQTFFPKDEKLFTHYHSNSNPEEIRGHTNHTLETETKKIADRELCTSQTKEVFTNCTSFPDLINNSYERNRNRGTNYNMKSIGLNNNPMYISSRRHPFTNKTKRNTYYHVSKHTDQYAYDFLPNEENILFQGNYRHYHKRRKKNY